MVGLGLVSGKNKLRTVSLSFRLPYFTNWGERILVCGSEPVVGLWNVKQGVLLSPSHEGDELVWSGTVTVSTGFKCEYSYYLVDDSKNVLRWEAGKKREVVVPEGIRDGEVVELHDLWQTASEALFFRSAFKNVICNGSWTFDSESGPENFLANSKQEDSVVVHFKISCPRIKKDASVYVIGSSNQLGMWKVQDGLKLRYTGKTGNIAVEVGPNRELFVESTTKRPANYIYLSDGSFREMPWRGAGVAIPMFSVRSEDDLGVGEFLDLKLLVDWAVESGFHLVQLLPVNDTSVHGMWWDSYPYSSLSVCALHPLYLRVQALSKNMSEEIKQEILDAKQQLDGKAVDYDATMATKLSIAKKIFSLEKDTVLNSCSFQNFLSENKEWLKPYAAFCFLRDFFETSDHSQWGRFSHYSEDKLEKLVSKDSVHYDIICFHYYIQFHLQLQGSNCPPLAECGPPLDVTISISSYASLSGYFGDVLTRITSRLRIISRDLTLLEAATYARKKRVVLKGDLPIGVGRNSVDTWVYPNLFRMDTATGAPPDYFDKNGQNWDFPTYNWEEMSKDNYAWWRSRLTQMGKYFTAYRIDHVLGFFRIWELPEHAITGLVGKFRPSIPLSQEELEKEGVWDFDRLSRPYIRQEHLQDKFGATWVIIASTFLNEYDKHCYEFKEDCNTEKKIVSKLKTCAEKSLWVETEDKVRCELFDLIQNIVLIRDPKDVRKFYPRFNLEDTSSFKDLDDQSKNILKRLYYDYYFYRQETLWSKNAMKTLPALLNSSDMLACGEDLGMIPACVHPVLQELGLIGLRIQRMPSEPGLEFGIPSQYNYMTVCAPSCHDCSPIRAWWEENEERRSQFYKTVVGSSDVPPSQCTPDIAHFMLRQHVESPSMWAIFPLQDLLALKEEYTKRSAAEETINDPTNPKHYWRFRVHVTMESLLQDKELKLTIRNLIKESGRSHPLIEEVEIKKTDRNSAALIPEKFEVANGGNGKSFHQASQLKGK
ncbi:hypothetical protein GIB67_016987 [Kingdonia uniflora]|uniref:4-alpha-glucanotransferase n=1 Tax=Kingdonia uniflora TaxID=39325 RepID=A0A7J7M3L2_9MAGN|nr:hypothetical protein GIB67_016987 [Kingdonia uniflora]